jgi:fermentation-respiration switch protein FrsA (DUF1100 family)
MLRAMLYALVLLVGYGVLACSIQRRLIYPRPLVPPRSAVEGRDDVRVAWVGPAQATEVWILPPRDAVGPVPYLVFTHGNGELIDDWLDAFATPRAWGMGVMLVEYPGYGRSPGAPSERSIREALLAAYDHLASQPDVDRGRIFVHGRSLGGGPACALARERPVAALILESTFTSLRPFFRPYGLVGPLVLDPFDNVESVEQFEGPLLVLHGERDEIIPVAHGRELASRARAAELHVLDCGHNDCPRPWPLLRAFLERNALLR